MALILGHDHLVGQPSEGMGTIERSGCIETRSSYDLG